jgi:hypothetical protein
MNADCSLMMQRLSGMDSLAADIWLMFNPRKSA